MVSTGWMQAWAKAREKAPAATDGACGRRGRGRAGGARMQLWEAGPGQGGARVGVRHVQR